MKNTIFFFSLFLVIVTGCKQNLNENLPEPIEGPGLESTSTLKDGGTFDDNKVTYPPLGAGEEFLMEICGYEEGRCDCEMKFSAPTAENPAYELDEVFILRYAWGDFDGDGSSGICDGFGQLYHIAGFAGLHQPNVWYEIPGPLPYTICSGDPGVFDEFFYYFWVEGYFTNASGQTGFTPFDMNITIRCDENLAVPIHCGDDGKKGTRIGGIDTFYDNFACVLSPGQDFVTLSQTNQCIDNPSGMYFEWYLDDCCIPSSECTW